MPWKTAARVSCATSFVKLLRSGGFGAPRQVELFGFCGVLIDCFGVGRSGGG